MELVGADSNLCAHAEFAAIIHRRSLFLTGAGFAAAAHPEPECFLKIVLGVSDGLAQRGVTVTFTPFG